MDNWWTIYKPAMFRGRILKDSSVHCSKLGVGSKYILLRVVGEGGRLKWVGGWVGEEMEIKVISPT